MKKCSVAIFIRGFHNGGIEKVFENYFTYMDLSCYDIHFITHMKNNVQRKEVFEKMGCTIHELSVIHGHRLNMNNIREYRDLFDSNRFDIVHNNLPENLLPFFFAKKHSVKKRILHAHANYTSDFSFIQKLMFPLYRIGYEINIRLSTHLVAISEQAGKSVFFKHYFTILPNAIELDKFTFSFKTRKSIREMLGLSDDQILIGHVGRMESDVKNHEFAIQVLNKICKKNPKYRLVFIGDGKKRPEYEHLVEVLGISDKVLFLGNHPNVNEFLMALDCFIFPSKKEGLGIAAIEAQASGLFCVISNHVPDAVKITDRAKFIDIDATDAVNKWSETILQLKLSNTEREQYVKTVQSAGYDIRTQVMQLSELYLSK